MNAGPPASLTDPSVTASRRRIMARTRLDFWLDALLLVAYTLAYSLGFTGIAVHEWLGIGLGLVLVVHLTLHWDWVIRTIRHLAAVVLTVAIIVALGMLWAHASGGTGTGGGLRAAPSREVLQRLEQVKTGAIKIQSDSGFQANTGNLVRTCEFEAVLAAVVITVSSIRRRNRRMRRSAEVRA